MPDLIDHYLHGGADLEPLRESLRDLADAQQKMLCPPRPFIHAGDAELDFERTLRRGPRWRCSHCAYLRPEPFWKTVDGGECHVPQCPECQNPMSYHRRPVTWPPVVAGRERDWVLAVAVRLGIELQPLRENHPATRCAACGVIQTNTTTP